MQSEFIFKDILENLRILSSENREILQKLSDNNLVDAKQSADIKSLQEKAIELNNALNKLITRIEILEEAKIEIRGFAKYIKILWAIAAVVAGYVLKLIVK